MERKTSSSLMDDLMIDFLMIIMKAISNQMIKFLFLILYI